MKKQKRIKESLRKNIFITPEYLRPFDFEVSWYEHFISSDPLSALEEVMDGGYCNLNKIRAMDDDTIGCYLLISAVFGGDWRIIKKLAKEYCGAASLDEVGKDQFVANPEFFAKETKEGTVTEKGWVWVKDNAGNQFVCHVNDLNDPKNISEEELENCMDDATMGVNIGD